MPKAYSYRIHALLMRTCIEVEANFKAILAENTFTKPQKSLNIRHYRRIDATHHLSSYEVVLPIWNGTPPVLKPFGPWKAYRGQPLPLNTDGNPDDSVVSVPWYQAYNASKHDRHHEFKQANFGNLVTAVAGLLVLLSAQFRREEFGAGQVELADDDDGYNPFEPAIGSLFRIKYAEDWSAAECYDFDWKPLKPQQNRFEKIDFNAIPS
jgi:hypothetical protein